MAQSAVRILKRAGRVAAAAAVIAALAGGFWYGSGALRDSENGSAKAGGSPLLIYSEFGSASDTVWAAQADDPTQRTRLVTIGHAPEYGISASLSPDGKHVAYTVLPEGGASAIDAPAEVWLMDRDGHNRKRLAADADLPVAPVWSPDSGAVVFRRSDDSDSGGRFQLVLVTTDGVERTLLDTGDGVFPVGFAPGGVLYFASLSTSGTDLALIRPDSSVDSAVAHLSDDFARDWHLSPDGGRLSYLESRETADRVSYVAVVLDLDASADVLLTAASATSSSPVDEFNPIWNPNGGITIGRLRATTNAGAPVLQVVAAGAPPVRAAAVPSRGFDVPLSWSPDAGYLAVRFYEGGSVTNPGRSWVTVTGADGARRTVSPNSDVEVLGWADSGG